MLRAAVNEWVTDVVRVRVESAADAVTDRDRSCVRDADTLGLLVSVAETVSVKVRVRDSLLDGVPVGVTDRVGFDLDVVAEGLLPLVRVLLGEIVRSTVDV